MEDNRTLLQVKDLSVQFKTDDGTITPVDGVSFSIEKGKTTALVGESGCGKSLTALSILGLVDYAGSTTRGSIRFEDRELVGMSAQNWRQIRGGAISMIFQEPLSSLNPVFTIGDQISESIILHQKVDRQAARDRSIELLRLAGIPRADKVVDMHPHSLSGGMRQRAMIAIALSCNPRLLIADEPTTALDVTIQAQILQLMRNLSTEFGTSVMLITHDLGVVAEMADDVIVMYAGQVVERSDVFSIFKSPRHPYTVGLLGSTPKMNVDAETLDAIDGVVPNPLNLPKGCRFYPRCKKATLRCETEMPGLYEVADGHAVCCFNYDRDGRA